MRAFITGATGFVGAALTLRLQRDGHDVTAWTRSPDAARGRLGEDVDILPVADGMDGLVEMLRRADVVINLAGAPIFPARWSEKRKRILRKSRVDVTNQLVEAMAALEPSRRPDALVSTSAVGYYGHRPGETLDEGGDPGESFVSRLCQDWEAAATDAESLGVRVAVVRLGVVLGRGGMLDTVLPIFRLGLGGPLGSGRQAFPWIHLDDAVEIFARAAVDPTMTGPYAAVAPDRVDNRTYTKTLASALGRPAWFRVPAFVLKIVFGEAASEVLADRDVVSVRLPDAGFEYAFPRLDAALEGIVGTDVTIRRIADEDISLEDAFAGSTYLEQRWPRYVLEHETVVDAGIDEVFEFFSKPSNLGVLTPPEMGFRIVEMRPEEMRAGTEIDYRIRVAGLPLTWTTRIEAWEPGRRFVDVQEKGPYRTWWHEHRFEPTADGRTRMIDRVLYSPPLGPLGRVANALFIERQLAQIFDYRSAVIERRFGTGGTSVEEDTEADAELNEVVSSRPAAAVYAGRQSGGTRAPRP